MAVLQTIATHSVPPGPSGGQRDVSMLCVQCPAYENAGFSNITQPPNGACLWLNEIAGSEIPLNDELGEMACRPCAIATLEVCVK